MSDKKATLYSGVVSAEEALKREKTAFVLDKAILKIVCDEGPISLEEIRRKTLPFEAAIGMKIDISTIKSILEHFIKEGLIWEK